jgi:hypothetical protein
VISEDSFDRYFDDFDYQGFFPGRRVWDIAAGLAGEDVAKEVLALTVLKAGRSGGSGVRRGRPAQGLVQEHLLEGLL